jgi:integrase
MVHDYKDKYWNEYKERDLSYHWLRGRFTKVKTVLNYSKKNGRTNKNELSRVLDWCKCLSVPAEDSTEQAQPIEREDVHKLFEVANLKMKTIMLLGLNCGYYAKDIHDLKKTMIMHKKGLNYIVFPREKNKHMRVNVLWGETKEALDEYMSKNPNNLDYVFTSQYGILMDPHDVQRCFDRLRKKAGVSKEVKFNNFRDGAATALFGKVNSDMLKVSIGHRIKGEKSKYISVKPEQVSDCAKYIWQEYFG